MGITIHVSGKLRDEASLSELVARVQRFATERSWRSETIDEPDTEFGRLVEGKYVVVVSPARGISVFAHPDCEPMRFRFSTELSMREHCKTGFAPFSVHVKLLELVHEGASLFSALRVDEEAEYWEEHLGRE